MRRIGGFAAAAFTGVAALAALFVFAPGAAWAEEAAVTPGQFVANNVWMMLCAGLVFLMHLGFATLESGLTRAKNTTNILFKNTFIIAAGILTYALCGFNLMYPGADNFAPGGFFGFAGFGLESLAAADNSAGYADAGYTYYTDFLFQAMFAATAATIVSGAVAERVKLSSFMIFATLFVAVVYPLAGSWKWGGGWLDALGFHDFAGSTLVHSVGGWGALVGALLLGPRLGKYAKGRMLPMPGSNLPLAAVGVFLLWIGWFGFNGGSVLSADPGATSYVLTTTCLAAAAGAVSAMLASWLRAGKPDLSMSLNGILAGLVGITAGADVVGLLAAVCIGGVAGVLVVFSVIFFDRVQVDDPVGAISVHLSCGIWGTLAVGLFSQSEGHTLAVQALGVLAYGVFTCAAACLIFLPLRATLGLRVSGEEERLGLDLAEHGGHAYDFDGLGRGPGEGRHPPVGAA